MTTGLPHHRATGRSAGDRGAGLGRALAEQVAVTVTTYRRLLGEAAGVGDTELREAGDAVAATLARRWPDLCEEIEGVAAGAAQDARELFAINARTELLAGTGTAGECSLAARLDGDEVRLVQSWDWHPDLAPATVLVTYEAGDGVAFTTVTEAGILAKLGMNSAGVAVGLNFLTCSSDGGLGGVPVHVLLRLLHERCTSAREALALLMQERTSASACITVAVRERGAPALFAVELSPGGSQVVWPDASGWIVHTNHFIHAPPIGHDTQPGIEPGTLLRRDLLSRRLAGGLDPHAALSVHAPAGECLCRHTDASVPWAERRATLLCTDLRPGEVAMRIATGPPCSSAFERVRA